MPSSRTSLAAALARALALAAAAAALGLWLDACGGTEAAGTFTPHTRGTLTVATAQIPNPGFWYGSASHPAGGFEYELARALASKLGLSRVRVVKEPFAQLIAGKLAGADLAISDITVTAQRAQHVSFSTSYLAAPPAILVRPGIQVPDLYHARALRWAVSGGTTLQSVLEETIRPTTRPLVTVHQPPALAALRSGRVQAVLLDLPVALAYAYEAPHTFAVAAQLPSEAALAAVLPKGSPGVEAVDSAIRALQANGTIEALGKRWLHTSLGESGAEHVPVLSVGE